jgi:hypothetical protein
MFQRTQQAATWLIPGVIADFARFEFCRRNLSAGWRIGSFVPAALGFGLLAITRCMKFW